MIIDNDIKAILPWMISVRRDLHRIPELAYKEFKTSKYIQTVLNKLKLPFMTVGTGVVVRIDGTNPKRCIGFRADIDGLEITEDPKCCNFVSTHPSVMHACGHDGHATMLLGFAKYLTKNPPKDNVVLVFQPGEEGGLGAVPMIESGLCHADVFYALHIDPLLETGKIGCAPGEFMAGRERFEIKVTGLSRHTSLRDGKQDAVLSCARLVCETRYLNSAGFIFQANIIRGGTAANVIADTATLTGTVRYFNDEVLQTQYGKLNAIIKAIEATDDVKIKIKVGDGKYPPLINTQAAFDKVKQIEGFVSAPKRFTAEDFALFIDKYSGALIWLGAKLDGTPLHNNKFNFDENALANGVQVFKQLLQE